MMRRSRGPAGCAICLYEQVGRLREGGLSFDAIARRLGISRHSAVKHMQAYRRHHEPQPERPVIEEVMEALPPVPAGVIDGLREWAARL